jgi:hypothetical protein
VAGADGVAPAELRQGRSVALTEAVMLTGTNGDVVTVTSGGGVVMGSDGLPFGRLVFVFVGRGVREVAGAREALRLAAIWRALAAAADALVAGWLVVASELRRCFPVAVVPVG